MDPKRPKVSIYSWGEFYRTYDPERKTSLEWECPNCKTQIKNTQKNVIGFEANPPILPKLNLRGKSYAVVVKCSSCQFECWFHVDETWIPDAVEFGVWPQEQTTKGGG